MSADPTEPISMKRPKAYATTKGNANRALETKRTWVLLLIGSHSVIPCTTPTIMEYKMFNDKFFLSSLEMLY